MAWARCEGGEVVPPAGGSPRGRLVTWDPHRTPCSRSHVSTSSVRRRYTRKDGAMPGMSFRAKMLSANAAQLKAKADRKSAQGERGLADTAITAVEETCPAAEAAAAAKAVEESRLAAEAAAAAKAVEESHLAAEAEAEAKAAEEARLAVEAEAEADAKANAETKATEAAAAAAEVAAAEAAAAEKAATEAAAAVAEAAAAEAEAEAKAAEEARLAAEAEAVAVTAAASQPSALGKRSRAVPPEEQQYTKLKYVPSSEGKRGAWVGKTVNGVDHEVYRSTFKTKYQQRCQANPNDWIKLPPGDAREPTDPAGCAADVGLQAAADPSTLRGGGSSVRGDPTVAYQQGRKDSCVLSSAASALFHLGETNAARVVAAHIPASLKHNDPMALLHDVLNSKKVKTVEVVCSFKRGQLDLLSAESLDPTTVQLLGEDGGTGHAVTIVGPWIFDATLPHALPLSRASLDECCSSARGGVAYVSGVRAVRFRQVASSGVSSL